MNSSSTTPRTIPPSHPRCQQSSHTPITLPIPPAHTDSPSILPSSPPPQEGPLHSSQSTTYTVTQPLSTSPPFHPSLHTIPCTTLLAPPPIHNLLTTTPTVVQHSIASSPQIGIGFWNVNGNSIDNQLPWHSWLMQSQMLDVLCLVDSRDPTSLLEVHKHSLQQVHPQHSIAISRAGPEFETRKLVVGGITMLISDRLAPCRYHTWSDPSGLGLILAASFRTSTKEDLLVIGVYVPVTSSNLESNQLEAQLHRWLATQSRPLDTMLYIRTALHSRISQHLKKPDSRVVLGGDFNLLADEVRQQLLSVPDAILPFDHHLTSSIPTRSLQRRGRRIDHIVTWQTDVLSHGLHTDEMLTVVTDHLPIWCHIPLTAHSPSRTALPIPPRPNERRLRSKLGKIEYQMGLQAWLSDNPSGTLEELCCKSATLLTPNRPRPKQRRRRNWSPEMMAHSYWFRLLIRLLRAHRHPERHHLQRIIGEAEEAITRIGPDGPQLLANLYQEYPLLSATLHDQSILLAYRRSTLLTLRSLTRKAHSAYITQATRRREEKFRKGQWGAVLRSLLNDSRVTFDMNRLQQEDGTSITSPKECHQALSDVFATWFNSTSATISPNGRSLWHLWSNDHTLLRAHLSQHAVPESLHDSIVTGVLHSDQGLRADIHSTLGSCKHITPTLQEFQEAVLNSPSGKAGGPLGVTYSMIGSWPPEILEWAYHQLEEIWSSRNFPSWWSTKLLVPIPKKPDPLLSDLRPIMLLEPLRKIWMGVIIRKVMTTWETHGILSDNQYGFRRHKSCGHAILQLVNAMEEAEEEATTILLSSWDIKRAFDSISREFIQLSLERLGVPLDIATVIAFMDEGDKVTVATPWHLANQDSGAASSFSTHQGTGQGDIVSPTLWTAFFDILLKTLQHGSVNNFFIRATEGNIVAQPDLAYADDLISISATPEALQHKADIVSAFALTFHLQLAVPKFRTAICHWDRIRQFQDTPGISIHGTHWLPTLVPFTDDLVLRYLGSTQNLDNSGTFEANKILDMIKRLTTRLRHKGGTAEMHVMATNAVIHSRAAYAGSFGGWSLNTYRQWDTLIAGYLKLKLHLPLSIANDILYAPLASGGLGLSRCSDKIQQAKYRLLLRCQAGSASSQAAVAGLMARLSRRSAHYLCADGSQIFPSRLPPGVPYWGRSLVEFLEEDGLNLRLPATHHSTPWDTSLISQCPPLVNSIDLLHEYNLITIGDIFTRGIHSSQLQLWPPLVESLPVAVKARLSSCQSLDPEHCSSVRPGQTWLRRVNGHIQSLVEVLGWVPAGIMVRYWGDASQWTKRESASPAVNGLHHRLLASRSSTLGCGSNDILSWESFLTECTLKALTSGDVLIRHGLYRRLEGWSQWRPLRPHPLPLTHPPWLPADIQGPLTIYTDGSWKTSDDELLISPNLVHQGCGLVIVSDQDPSVPVLSLTVSGTDFSSPLRAFAMEMFGLTLGLQAATFLNPTPVIHSDCKGAIALVRHRHLFTHPMSALNIRCQSLLQGLPAPTPGTERIQWVEAHPEGRHTFTAFQPRDWGNFWADKAAGGVIVPGGAGLPREVTWPHYQYTFHDILSDASLRHPSWSVYKEDAIFVGGLTYFKSTRALACYLDHRSLTKDIGLGPWTSDNLNFLISSCQPRSLRQRSALLQLYLARFDRDRVARSNTPTPCLCGTGIAHLKHWIHDCPLRDMVDSLKELRQAITSLFDLMHRPLQQWLLVQLFDNHDENIWRGIWTPTTYATAMTLCRSSIGVVRKLSTATRLITTTSLSLHTIDSTSRRAPATAAASNSLRIPSSQQSTNSLLNYGFQIAPSSSTQHSDTDSLI